nr:UDP-2,3-diacylglucosamine diphosphatase [Pelodictyon luteolum]
MENESMRVLYFISDIHLGLQEEPEERRKLEALSRLFAEIRRTGGALYMLGDVFDYWMEYRHVVPKGFTGFFCLLSGLVQAGVEVTYLAGNHDFHLGTFFDRELGVKTRYGTYQFDADGRHFTVAHGDGLGEGDLGYRLFAKFIRNPFNLGLLTGFHPDLATGLMKRLSRLSRKHKPGDRAMETDRLLDYAHALVKERSMDYFLCGHNHAGGVYELEGGARYVNLGSWIDGRFPYAVYMDRLMQLKEL